MEYELTNIIYDNSEYELEIENENIEIQDFSLEELTVLPSREQQVITPTQPKTYYNKVTVEPIITENIEVQSSVEDKVVTPTTGKFINEVTVKGDSNLISENIKKDVTILGVAGNLDTLYKPNYISFRQYKGDNLDYELSNLDTSKVTDMSFMFYSCSNLNSLNLSKFNTSNVTNMTYMFEGCSKIKSLNLSNLDTSKVTNMSYMFESCQNIKSLDLSNFNTSKVTDMRNMFNANTNLNSINLSNFNTSKVTNMAHMFYNSPDIEKIDISSFTSESLTSNSEMFRFCSNLTILIINNPNVFKMTNSNMLNNTPIASGTGYVYVPDNMVETYKSATNWNIYANQIKGISELPEGA